MRIAQRVCVTIGFCAALPAWAQAPPNLRIQSQASLAVNCTEPNCDCIDASGAPVACPDTHVRNYDSGYLAAPATDSHDASVSGTFVGFDATTVASMEADSDVSYGTLKGFALAHGDASGTYVDAGGLAIPSTGSAYVSLQLEDYMIVHAPVPGGTVMLSFGQSIASTDLATIGGGGLSIDVCLANGDATTHLEALTSATALTSGGYGSATYARLTNECSGPIVTGSPIGTFTITADDAERVNFGQGVTLDVHAYMGAGLGTNPNRALAADALLDASSTAHLYVEVLTPGASYETGSGTVYETPETDAAASAGAALALLGAVARRRRMRG